MKIYLNDKELEAHDHPGRLNTFCPKCSNKLTLMKYREVSEIVSYVEGTYPCICLDCRTFYFVNRLRHLKVEQIPKGWGFRVFTKGDVKKNIEGDKKK